MSSSPRFWDLSTLPKLTVDSGLAGSCLAEEFRVCIGVWVRNCLPQAQTLSYPSFDFIQPSCFLAPQAGPSSSHLCRQLSLSCFHFTLP